MLQRGFEIDVVDTWSERDAFALDIGVWLYAKRQGWDKNDEEDSNWLNQYNRIEELETVPLLLDDGTILTTKTDENSTAMAGVDLNEIYED